MLSLYLSKVRNKSKKKKQSQKRREKQPVEKSWTAGDGHEIDRRGTRESCDPGRVLFEMYHDLESAHAVRLRNGLVNPTNTVDTNRTRRYIVNQYFTIVSVLPMMPLQYFTVVRFFLWYFILHK